MRTLTSPLEHRRERSMTVMPCSAHSLRLSAPLLALLLAGLLASGSPPALAQNDSDWQYTVRDGESLEDVASRLLKRDRSADELRRHNSLSSSRLEPGDRLQIPMQWLDQAPKPARVLSVTGEASVRFHLQRRFSPLRPGEELNVGDTLRTADALVVMELADGSRVQLGEESELTFDRLTQFGQSGMADTRLNLERGRMRTRVKTVDDGDTRFQVETPSAVAAVRGTRFDLSTDANGTHLGVEEGQVWFGQGDEHRMIPAGYSASRSDTGDMQVRPLPSAPEWDERQSSAEELPLSLSWKPRAGAQGYQVDLKFRDDDEWLLSERVNSEQIRLQDLDNGDYRLTLAAVDHEGRRSKSRILDFTVDLSAEPAHLVAPERDDHLPIDDARFKWTFQGNNEKARVEVARDSDFDDKVAISDWSEDDNARIRNSLDPDHYYWRVTTRAGGTSQAHSDVAAFTLTGRLNETRVITVNQVDEHIRVFWQQVDHADRYQLQLSRDSDFDDLVKESTFERSNAELDLEPGKTFYVRIRGQADGPYDSDWGPSYQITLE